MQQVPTLLLGLGGIGSQVVDRIYGKIPEGRRDRIAVHTFDTNINDIRGLDHLTTREHVTQTSTKQKVRDYLHQAENGVLDWFPKELPSGGENVILLNKTLTDGAGQVRPVSRLAYRAALEKDGLDKLKQQVENVFSVSGGGLVENLRVMVVCSLTGGTGAGLFLQTSLYLREYLTRNGTRNVLIRGAFVLPDIVIKRTPIRDKYTQHDNLRANAYASLRELDALCTQDADTHIELEYKPGQTDLSVSPAQVPYRFSFLYDFENTGGQNLGSFEGYLRQVIETTHLQLFTPLAEKNFSQEDNEILSLIGAGGKNRYCGAGVSSLEYPYEDLVEYCALRWSTDSLSDQWLRIDEAYQRELQEHKRAVQQGEARRERPQLSERHVRLLDNYAEDEDADPFFERARRSAYQKDDKGRTAGPKALAFLEAIEELVEKHVESDEDVGYLLAESEPQDAELTERSLAQNHVLDVEENLYELREVVKKEIDDNQTLLSNQVLLRDQNEPGMAGGQSYRLNTWLLAGEDAPLHPVAVRYVLYQVLHRLEERIQTLKSENEDLWAGIERYEETYDDPETEDVVERPQDRLRKALEQGFWARLFNDKFDEFVDRYRSGASKQRRSLRKYYQDKLTEGVFSNVRDAVRTMLDYWERFFRNLDDASDTLAAEINRRTRRHVNEGDPTRRYVLATPEEKEALWEEIGLQLSGDVLPAPIAREIYLGQYKRLCRHLENKAVRSERKEDTLSMFREDVVAWCRQEVRKEDRLDKNIIQALYEEAEREDRRTQEEKHDYIQDEMQQLTNLARPFIPDINRQNKSETNLWGAHPDSVQDPSDQDDQRGTLPRAQTSQWMGESLARHESFSPYELLCYRAHYGLEVGDFPKFFAGDDVRPTGTYYQAYQERLEQLTGQNETTESVTPHLDKRWHIPTYLPDTINPEAFERNRRRSTSAFVQGLALGFFEQVMSDGRSVWQFSGKRGPRLVKKQGDAPVPDKLHLLLEAVRYNPYIVDEVIDQAQDLHERDKSDHPVKKGSEISQHRFHQGCHNVKGMREDPNLLEAMLGYPLAAPGTPGILQQSYDILDHTLEEIVSYYEFVFGPSRTNTARERAADLIEKLRKRSPSYENADPNGQMKTQWDSRIDRALDELRS